MKKFFIAFLLIFYCGENGVSAQVNTDSVFSSAIHYAKMNQYHAAIQTAQKALNASPGRGDIMVFVANVYSWQSKNDSAMVYIQKAQLVNCFQSDLYESWTNILLRTHQYAALLKCCDEAEMRNYSSEDILKKRLISYGGLKNYKAGVQLAELTQNRIYLNHEPINSLYSDLLLKGNTNVVSANYNMDFFDASKPQYLSSLGYSFHVGKHTLGFRANYANRFAMNDLQLESDFYLQLPKKRYLYFNYGLGFRNALFPKHRLGVEYYFQPIPKTDVSLGSRYFSYPASQVLILTGSMSQYFGKGRVMLRPFYVFTSKSSKQSFSLIGNYRLFAKTEFTFWGLELGYGNSPDDRYSVSQINGFNQLTSYKFKIEKSFMVNRISDICIGLGYTREEFITNTFRNRYVLEVGYKLRL